jgi:hypothetical protein
MSSATEKQRVESLEVDQLRVEQLQIGKHAKIRNDAGSIAVHASKDTLGVWLDSNVSGPTHGTICVVARSGQMPYVAVWPKKDYRKSGNALPFALSAEGLQVPHPDGTNTILPLEKLAALVKQLAE